MGSSRTRVQKRHIRQWADNARKRGRTATIEYLAVQAHARFRELRWRELLREQEQLLYRRMDRARPHMRRLVQTLQLSVRYDAPRLPPPMTDEARSDRQQLPAALLRPPSRKFLRQAVRRVERRRTEALRNQPDGVYGVVWTING